MEMIKENFDKMIMIDGWMHKEGSSNTPNAKHTYQSSYLPPSNKCENYSMFAVYTYPDRYDVKAYYRNGNHINVSCETENEAYGLLYRFIYTPDTINFAENGEKVTEEELAKTESKRRWSLKNLFRRA